MNKLDCNLSELVNILVTTEGTLKSSRGSILAVEQAPSKRKSQRKKKNKLTKKQKKESKPKKDTSKKAVEKGKCFYYNSDSHWRRNYPSYLESLKMKKSEQLSEGMLITESNLMIFSTSNWVLNSSSSAHICTSMQGLIESRRLRKDDMILRIGNGARVAAVAIGTYLL